jgi:hypothetical protein
MALLLWGLAACTPARFPLEITALSVSPEPVVGQVVTVRVEIESTSDEDDVTVLIQIPKAVRLMDGTPTWHGSLRAGEPQVHLLSVCVLIEGDWRIDVTVSSRFPDGDTYGDYNTLHLISSADSGLGVPGHEYRATVPATRLPPSPSPRHPTPVPGTCQ